MSDTIFAPSINLLWSVLQSLNIEPISFIEATIGRRIDPRKRHDPNFRLPYHQVEKVWLRLEQVAHDECLGIKIASMWHPSQLGALGYAWLASSTLRTAFTRLERYIRMVSGRFNVTLEESSNQFSVNIKLEALEQQPVLFMDGIIAITVDMCRTNLGDDLNLKSVHFDHAEPRCAGQFYSYFRCPVIFESDANQIVFSKDDIDKTSGGSNTVMADASDRIIIDYLARMDKADIVDRVKSEIINQLPSGSLTDDSVSGALHVSTRTMQRMLNDKSTTFTNLLSEIRQDLAMKYVKDQSLSLTEISFLLGFSEISSFSRAFKRWTGKSPSETRIED
ncbi:MAG: AraC family transcriptional regulator [Gammaproteobacteria bacterium]|nr:MAG: AraC family transcriptional regulator [Gammaproteobacteria bacterium]